MSIRTKAASLGVAAIMVASLAGTALGASTVSNTATPTGPVVRGADYVGTASYSFTEAAVNQFTSPFDITITIWDSAGNGYPAGPSRVHFDKTSAVTLGPDSLGLSYEFAAANDWTLIIHSATSNTAQIETLTIGNLKVKADANAALGAITTYYVLSAGETFDLGGNTQVVGGQLAAGQGIGDTSIVVVLDSTTPPLFQVTGAGIGNLVFADATAESIALTGVSGAGTPLAGQQTLTVAGPGLVNPHSAATRVSQTLTADCTTAGPGTCKLASIGTVVDSVAASAAVQLIQRGLANSQQMGQITLAERPGSAGYIPAGATITLTLDPATGVKFSAAPTAALTGGAGLTFLNGGVAVLSADRLSAVFTTTAASTAAATITINGLYDASAAAAAAASVSVGIAISGVNVVPSSVVNAVLNNTAEATADAPTVIIGENDQQSGTITVREAAAAAFGTGAGTNIFAICYLTDETFTRAPWAVVTAGDLVLRASSDPTVPSAGATPGTGVRGQIYTTDIDPGPGTHNVACAQWITYTASTVASTIEIRGSAADGTMLGAGAAHGPQINVGAQLVPGPSTVSLVASGLSYPSTGSEWTQVVNAVRVYGGSPVVAAVSNPEIYRGQVNQAAGDVTITETQTWQLAAGQGISFHIVPNNLRDQLPSVYFDTNRNLPVVSTNGAVTGLIAHFEAWIGNTAFRIRVDQRAFVPITGAWVPGVITISNLKYNTTTDAAYGNVELAVFSPAVQAIPGTVQGAENPANISDVVTNAHVVSTGLFPSLQIAAGYKTRETTPYQTYGTLVVKKGSYVTVKVRIGTAFAGKRIEFWQRNGKSGTWVRKTIGRVDAAGYAYWSTRPPKLSGSGFDKYVYYRAYFAGTSEVAAAWSQTIGRVVVK